MISKGIETGFNKLYYLIKLSLYFWGLTFIGLIIFGFTPAMMAIIEEHSEANWDYDQIKLKHIFENFKQYFNKGNKVFLIYLMIFLIIGYSLFIALQTNGLLFLVLDFTLIFILFMLILSFTINLAVLTLFEISIVNSLKLSIIQFFIHTKECFLLIFGLVILSLITYKIPGLILFVSIGLLAGIISISTERMFQNMLID